MTWNGMEWNPTPVIISYFSYVMILYLNKNGR